MRFIGGDMRLPLVAFLALIFWGFLVSQKAEASSPAQGISQVEGKRNVDAILKYLWPALKSAKKAGRIYYYAACQPNDNDPVQFPRISAQPPSISNTGLAAVQEMFEKDKSVKVTEGQPGIISIRIGNVPDAILRTKISLLALQPRDQYNDFLALRAIENTKEVQAAMRKRGVRTVSPIVINMIMVEPAEGAPHLPSSMTNVTVDQALDLVAKTFRGIVLYGACMRPSLYKIDFTGGIYFDDSKLIGSGSEPGD
ncbi:MAG TPA: hypothetical protein VFF41_07635 [Gallionella sp.]|nr:hypothetical protein [Gallionella sp.]